MKVLFTASLFSHFTSFHIPYMKLFQEKGFEVWAAAANISKHEKKMLESLGIKCLNVPFVRSPFSKKNILAYRQLKRLASEQSFELIHVHTPVASFMTRLAFRNRGKGKMLYTAHGFHFFKGSPKINWILYYCAEVIARKWTDGLIVINKEDYENAKKLGYKKEQVFFVHGVGVDISSYQKRNVSRLQKELRVDSNHVILSYIAELNDNKNHHFLLRNWNSLLSAKPELFLLVIGDGEKAQELKEYVETNKLENVKFLGYRKDVIELLNITDIVILLSKREGLPKSIMEAMATKIPCIVTNTRGLRDLIKDGENGYIIEQGDNEQLQSTIVQLVNNNRERKIMGNRAFELVQPYNIQNVLKEYEEIYEIFLENYNNNTFEKCNSSNI